MAKLPYGFDHSTARGQERLMRLSVGQPVDMLDRKITVGDARDHGCDPLGDGKFKMVPSGDIVDGAERDRRLKK